MYRNLLPYLLEWQKRVGRKALILKGARQVGKTWLIRELARTLAVELIELNFEKEPRFKSLFQESLASQHILTNIELMLGRSISWDKALLFWDEVQESPRALTALKHFTDSAPQVTLIAAGSYLGMLEGKVEGISQPVGYVDEMTLTPLSFDEFVQAADAPFALKQRLVMGGTPTLVEHQALLSLYRDYLFVGGMPELVALWFKNNEQMLQARTQEIRERQKLLMSRLKADFAKYHLRDAIFISRTWELIAEQLSRSFQEVNRFTFKEQISGKRDYKGFSSYFTRLEACGLIFRTAVIEHPLYPLKAQRRESFFKAYFFDSGLLLAEMDYEYQALTREADIYYKGPLAENFIACTLARLQLGLYCYKKTNSTAEIEFVVQSLGKIIPIEVKNNQSTAKSLRAYMEEFKPPLSIKFSNQQGAIQETLIHVPIYLCEWALKHYILDS